MHTQNLVKFYQFVLKILSWFEIMMDGQNDGMNDNPNTVYPPPFFKAQL